MRILLITLFIFIISTSLASEIATITDSAKDVSFSLGVTFSHFIPTGKAKELYWKTSVVNLGGESLIRYRVNKNFGLSSGVNYQYGKISTGTSFDYYGDRTMFHEITFPVLADYPCFKISETKFFLTTGVYLGKYSKIKRQTKGNKLIPGEPQWHDYPNPIGSESQKFVCDYYFSLGNKSAAKIPVYFELFFKYRINEHWLNENVSKFMYGIKIKHQLKFTR